MLINNECRLKGNVGKDPEVTYQDSGLCVANFHIAVSEKWKDRTGEWKEKTDWFPVTCFGDLAKSIEMRVQKGTRLNIIGRLTTDQWEKDGKKYSKTYVRLQEYEIVSGGKKMDDLADVL